MKCFYIILLVLFLSSSLYAQNEISQFEFKQIKMGDPTYKQNRKEYHEFWHKTAPGVDYNKINNALIQSKSEKINNSRLNFLNKRKYEEALSSTVIANDKVFGEWVEKGSNNLSGRMHNCVLSKDKKHIYAASAGGYIWKSDILGNNWECLNTSFFMGNIKTLRLINVGSKTRIIAICSNPINIYFSDNDGITWEVSEGLEGPQAWGGIKRAIISNDSQQVIYFVANEWNWDDWHAESSLYLSYDFGKSFKRVYATLDNSKNLNLWTSRVDLSQMYFFHADTLSVLDHSGKITFRSVLNSDIVSKSETNITGSSKFEKDHICVSYYKDGFLHYYYSEDSGYTWINTGSLEKNQFSHNSFAMSYDNPDLLLVGQVDLFKSYDRGATWTKMNHWGHYYGDMQNKLHADIPAIDVFIDNSGNELTYINTDGGTYISTDFGENYNNISLRNLNVSQYYHIYSHRDSTNFIFAGAQDQGMQRSLKSSDNTQEFEQIISGDYAHLTSGDGGETVWSTYPGFVQVHTNITGDSKRKAYTYYGKGALWLPPMHADLENPKIAYMGLKAKDSSSHLYKYTLNEDGIISEEMPFVFSTLYDSKITAVSISELNHDYMYLSTSDGNFFTSTDRGTNWIKTEGYNVPNGNWLAGAGIRPSPSTLGTVYIAGSGYSSPGVLVSYDNGKTFDSLVTGLPETLIRDIAVSPNDRYLFVATEVGPYIYIKSEGQWFPMEGITAPVAKYTDLEYIAKTKTVRFSTYGRGIWDFKIEKIIDFDPPILQQPGNERKVSAKTIRFKWDMIENADNYHIQISDNELFDNILFENDNTSSNEIELSDLPNTILFWRVKVKNHLAESEWSDVWSFEYKPVSLEEDQNITNLNIYPNPFTSKINIELDLTEDTEIYLSIIDIHGNEIAILKDGMAYSGKNAYEFLPNNLASGTYFCKLKIADTESIQKIFYMK